MKEISYQIFDEVSGLPIESLSNECIREFAQRFNKSNSGIFNEMKAELKKEGIKYMIPGGTKKIKVVFKRSMSACNPTYFDDYQDALNFIKEDNNE